MNYTDWINTFPAEIRQDSLWNQEVYRLALFASDLGWSDATKLFRDGRTSKLAAQLIDAIGSIGANISEGYSRGHHKDRARFYEYALGSTRKSRTWYFDGRPVLGDAVAQHRIRLHTHIIRLLLKMLPAVRGYTLHEADSGGALVAVDDSEPLPAAPFDQSLETVPIFEI
jgi:four helix bundle protein